MPYIPGAGNLKILPIHWIDTREFLRYDQLTWKEEKKIPVEISFHRFHRSDRQSPTPWSPESRFRRVCTRRKLDYNPVAGEKHRTNSVNSIDANSGWNGGENTV